MARAIFVVPIVNSNADLNIAQLVGDPPVDGYGFSLIGQVPQVGTCLCLISSSETILDALDADPKYLFVEDVIDGEET